MTSKTFNVKDEECLLWIKDPSFSPFTKSKGKRRQILTDEDRKNPLYILNKIKRRCFFNTGLRDKIVKQIKEYQQNNTLRLYESNLFEYTIPHFNDIECKRWIKNHFVNPRTNDPIDEYSPVYTELVYTTLQYNLQPPAELNMEDYTYVIKRLELIKEIDDYFLHNDIGTIDLPRIPKVKDNTFDVSSSLNTSLSPVKKRILMDKILEKKEEERLLAYFKRSRPPITDNFFTSLRTFLFALSNDVENGDLINNFSDNFYIGDIKDIHNDIKRYFKDKKISDTEKKMVFGGIMPNFVIDDNNLLKLIKHLIRNIYLQLIDPSLKASYDIEYFSYINCEKYLNKLTAYIIGNLHKYIRHYKPDLNNNIKNYLSDIIDDIISTRYFVKRGKLSKGNNRNYYYILYLEHKTKQPTELRLPEGMGFANISNMFDIDQKIQNNFTYEECKNWVIMPIINPRTLTPIFIDSPLYNRLLCMSYQYDTNLIPRMLSNNGYSVLITLKNTIEDILKKERRPPQTREQLEEYNIRKSFRWKIIGMKQPDKGSEIVITNEMRAGIMKSLGTNAQMPFYININEDDLRIKDITKNSYIRMKDFKGMIYYYTIVMNNDSKRNEVINPPIVIRSMTDYSKFNIFYNEWDCAEWVETPNKNPITGKEIEQDSSEYNSIFEQALLFNTSAEPIDISSEGIKFKKMVLKTIPDHYSIGDCLRWIRQPDINPKTGNVILTDGKEYNTIFEKALLFDSNIIPYNITETGKKYKKAYLKRKRMLYGIEKVSKRRIKKDEGEYSKVLTCDAINNIFEGDKRYHYFKKKMIWSCEHYNTEYVCMDKINAAIKEHYKPFKEEDKLSFDYYEDSPLASAVIYFNKIRDQLNNNIFQDIFSNNYTRFYVTILAVNDEYDIIIKEAIDAGGPIREFLTKFFEELFCDEEHLTRPFIRPIDNVEKYYINPNFVLDENYKKVIAAYKGKFDVSMDPYFSYTNIYNIIGKVLCIAVVNEDIDLPKQLSTYIIAGLIKQPKDITLYDLFYFYVSEFNNGFFYMNMINTTQFKHIEAIGSEFNDNYIISNHTVENPNGYKVTKDNCIKFLLQLAKHIITKNFLHKSKAGSAKSMKLRYASLFKGFDNKIRAFLANNKVNVVQLNGMITNKKIDDVILQEFASKIKITMEGTNTLTDTEKEKKLKGIQDYITNIITNKANRNTVEEHYNFIRRLLRFWTAIPYYDKDKNYTIYYKYGKDENGKDYNVENLPESHTCSNQLEFFGFPSQYRSPVSRENFIYKKIQLAISNTPGIDNR
jgi:hypothetical protein